MMDITTEVGTHILVSANLHSVGEAVNRVQHESENLSGLHNQIESNQPTTNLQILRFSGSQSPATLTKRQAHEFLRTKRMAQ